MLSELLLAIALTLLAGHLLLPERWRAYEQSLLVGAVLMAVAAMWIATLGGL